MRKFRIKFRTRMSCVKEIEAKSDEQANEMAENIADNLEHNDFNLDHADIEVYDIKEIDQK